MGSRSADNPDVKIGKVTQYRPSGKETHEIFDVLTVSVEVDIRTAGFYTVTGLLTQDGEIVSNQPSFEYTMPVRVTIGDQPGIHPVVLSFSGEQILRSGKDGPYELVITVMGSAFDQKTITTPAYRHTLFGECGVTLPGRVSDVPVDTGGDGRYNFLEITLDTTIAIPGEYTLQGILLHDGGIIGQADTKRLLAVGEQKLTLRFPGVSIFRSGRDGPYDAVLAVLNAKGKYQADTRFVTQAYAHLKFEGFLGLDGTLADQGIDTNGNGLYDVLQIDFGVNLHVAGTFLVSAELSSADSTERVTSDLLMTLAAGSQTFRINLPGPEIHTKKLDGPYAIQVVLRHPETGGEMDRLALPSRTGAYVHTAFDPPR